MRRLVNVLLIVGSLVFGFVICEVFLRAFYPKYQYAAESQYNENALRIWSREAGASYERVHPDDSHTFPVIHNNLSFRQHRNFDEEDLTSGKNIAFFGDSFVENLRVESQYSFTEPLEYLLNLTGERFNVLNLGVDGYGTDQSFLYYKEFGYRSDLDYVFYVFCHNDIGNIYENGLFSIDEDTGELVTTVKRPRAWTRLVSGFHTTYLILDSYYRIFGEDLDLEEVRAVETRRAAHAGREERLGTAVADSIHAEFKSGRSGHEELNRTVRVFNEILRRWQRMAEESGSKFFVVTLPMEETSSLANIIDDDIPVLDMLAMCKQLIPDYDYSDWRFRNDVHWNEAGNMLAAFNLFVALENEEGLNHLPASRIIDRLNVYYGAFHGWMPESAWASAARGTALEERQIREKYLALEGSAL